MNTSESEATTKLSTSRDDVREPNHVVDADEMDWHAYAEHYDEMCALNPAYYKNVSMLLERLSSWNLPEDASICDLGAGTGNYILGMHQILPSANYWHVDIDERMIECAKQKYSEAGIANVHVVYSDVCSLSFPADSFDVVVCVNALYAFTSQDEILSKIRSWLKPNGKLFLIDFGRSQKTLDWTLYMLWEAIKSNQLARYFRALIGGRELLKQNRRTTRGQASGRYWLHSTSEFGEALRSAGFVVEELETCYRDYSDFAVCTK